METNSQSQMPPATYYGTLILISYILGGQELHPLCHLVAEAQQIVIGENGWVTDDQVQPAATWSQWQGETTNRWRRWGASCEWRHCLVFGGNSGCPVTAWPEIKLIPFICCNICLYILSGLWSKSKLCSFMRLKQLIYSCFALFEVWLKIALFTHKYRGVPPLWAADGYWLASHHTVLQVYLIFACASCVQCAEFFTLIFIYNTGKWIIVNTRESLHTLHINP